MGLTGMGTLRKDGLLGRVTTGVGGACAADAAAVRAARMERFAPRARLVEYETLGCELKDAWRCDGPPAPEMDAKLGAPKP